MTRIFHYFMISLEARFPSFTHLLSLKYINMTISIIWDVKLIILRTFKKVVIFHHFWGSRPADQPVSRSRHSDFSQTFDYHQNLRRDDNYMGMTFIFKSLK